MLYIRHMAVCSTMAIAMRTAVPIDLYCYADIDYTVIAADIVSAPSLAIFKRRLKTCLDNHSADN